MKKKIKFIALIFVMVFIYFFFFLFYNNKFFPTAENIKMMIFLPIDEESARFRRVNVAPSSSWKSNMYLLSIINFVSVNY